MDKERWEINERILKIIEEGRKKFEMVISLSDYARYHTRKSNEYEKK